LGDRKLPALVTPVIFAGGWREKTGQGPTPVPDKFRDKKRYNFFKESSRMIIGGLMTRDRAGTGNGSPDHVEIKRKLTLPS